MLQLVTELLEDIELERGSVRAIVLKASRLARLVGDEEAQEWLSMEMSGYSNSEVGRKYMSLTGRWLDKQADTGFWQGLLEIESQVTVYESKLAVMRLPDVSGEWASIALRETRQDQTATAQAITRLAAIRAKVIASIHRFAVTRYYELAFSEQQAELFEHARLKVDQLLSPLSGNVLSKVDTIYRRLAEDDVEAISQALSTCRRLIDSVADAIYPARYDTLEVNGQLIKLEQPYVQNRLNAYVRERTDSESRRSKFRRTLSDLYARVSAGVHSEVSADEARFLFSQYLPVPRRDIVAASGYLRSSRFFASA